MATTMGGNSCFVYDEMFVVQDTVDCIGTVVDSLIMEFDQAAYEPFH